MISGSSRSALRSTYESRIIKAPCRLPSWKGVSVSSRSGRCSPACSNRVHRLRSSRPARRLPRVRRSRPISNAPTSRRSAVGAGGQVVFNNDRLDAAIAELNRYTTSRIELADPALASLKVSGVFYAGRSDSFLETVTGYYPIRIVERSGERIVLGLETPESAPESGRPLTLSPRIASFPITVTRRRAGKHAMPNKTACLAAILALSALPPLSYARPNEDSTHVYAIQAQSLAEALRALLSRASARSFSRRSSRKVSRPTASAANTMIWPRSPEFWLTRVSPTP